MASRTARLEGREVAARTAARTASRWVDGVKVAGVQLHIGIGFEAQFTALVALKAQSVIFGALRKPGGSMQIMATGAGGHIALSVAAQGKLIHRAFVALAAELCEVFISEAAGGFAADSHAALFVHIVAVGAGSRVAREVGRGEKSLDDIPARVVFFVVTGDAGFMADFKWLATGIGDKQTEATTLSHVGEPGAMARLTGDVLVGAAQKFPVVGGASAIMAGQAGVGADLARSEVRLFTSIHAHGQGRDNEETG